MVLTTALVLSAWAEDFKKHQLRHSRVEKAYQQKSRLLKSRFEQAGLSYPPERIFIRAFKRDRVLELWAWSDKDSLFKRVHSYSICAVSGALGPKRAEGDLQVPEGFYHITRFNPVSKYHLSLQINYPNSSDRILGKKGDPGSLIFIHGDCVTIGCIPITNKYIQELYIAAVDAKDNGQDKIPVHIFPFRMKDDKYEKLKSDYPGKKLHDFWGNIKTGYDYFETHRRLPEVTVNQRGKYVFK